MASEEDIAATTDGISNFSIGNHTNHESPRSPPSGLRLNRKLATELPVNDVTSIFQNAARHLVDGELIKDEFFTLFDSVGALEIMDSKMDSGHLESGEKIEDNYDTLRPILPEELIAIMDSLLCLQVAWQSGYPLSQTIFASVYIESMLWPEPKTLVETTFRTKTGLTRPLDSCQNALRAYCLLLIKSCDFIFRRITEETYYEEEDFFTQLYNRSLLTSFSADQIMKISEDAIQDLQSVRTIDEDICNAIISRLQLQQRLFQATLDSLESMPETVTMSWWNAAACLPAVQNTVRLGKAVLSAVSTKLQRKLASSVPPRPVIETRFETAIEFLQRLCETGQLVEQVAECDDLESVMVFVVFFQSRHPQPTVYMRCQLQRLILRKFEFLGDPKAALFAQPYMLEELVRLVCPNRIAFGMEQTSIRQGQAESDPYQQEIDDAVYKFTAMVNEPVWAYIRALTMNRSRTRRMLCHTAIEWDSVQLELEDLDLDMRKYTGESPLRINGEELPQYPLSSWAYDIKLRQLILVSQLGFELEVYHKEELSSTYWSQQWICSLRHSHLERIMLFVKDRVDKLQTPSPTELDQINASLLTIQYHLDNTLATMALSEALAGLYRVLQTLNLLPSLSTAPYSNAHFRHALRNKPYQHIIHPSLPDAAATERARSSYTQQLITQARAANHTPPRSSYYPTIEEALALLDHVDSMTKSARKAWEKVSKTSISIARAVACEKAWREDIKNTLKSAIALGVAAMSVRKWIVDGAIEGAVEVEVKMGHEAGLYHVMWVVPTVKLKVGKSKVVK